MKNLMKLLMTAVLGFAMMAGCSMHQAEASTCAPIDVKLTSMIGARSVTECGCTHDGPLLGISFDLDALLLDGLVGNILDGLLGGGIRKVVTHDVPVSMLGDGALISFKLCGLAQADLVLQYREHGTTNWLTLWTSAELNLLGHPLRALIDVNVAVPAGLAHDTQFRFLQVLPLPLLDIDLDINLLNFWTLLDLHVCIGLPVLAPPTCELPAPVTSGLVLDVDATVGSLGAIADSLVCGVAGPAKEITFEVSGAVAPLVSIDLDIDIRHFFAPDLVMTLISPGGVAHHVLFKRPGLLNLDVDLQVNLGASLDGHYIFADCQQPSLLSLSAALDLHLGSLIPVGAYHTCDADGNITLMLDSFARLTTEQLNGQWILRIEDYCRMYSGVVLGAHLRLGLL